MAKEEDTRIINNKEQKMSQGGEPNEIRRARKDNFKKTHLRARLDVRNCFT